MSRTLTVLLNGHTAGVLSEGANAKFTFAYEDAWRSDPNAYPLSLSLPLTSVEHGDKPTRTYLEGLFPDNSGGPPSNSFDGLEEHGANFPGAVEFVAASIPPAAPSEADTDFVKRTVGLDGELENQTVCTLLAGALGIPVAKPVLDQRNDETVLVSPRFDRVSGSAGNITRIHQENICQSLGVCPADRFEKDGGPGISAIIKLFRKHSAQPEADVTTFIETVALTWIMGVTNAHAANFSLLIGPGSIRLAPISGLTSALPYSEISGKKMKLAMKIGGDYQTYRIGTRQWSKLADKRGLDSSALMARIHLIAAAIPDVIGEVTASAREAGADHPVVLLLEQMISKRAIDCMRILESRDG